MPCSSTSCSPLCCTTDATNYFKHLICHAIIVALLLCALTYRDSEIQNSYTIKQNEKLHFKTEAQDTEFD